MGVVRPSAAHATLPREDWDAAGAGMETARRGDAAGDADAGKRVALLAKHLAPPPRWTLLWEARVGVARPTSAAVGSTAILAFWLHAVLLMFACCYLLPEAAFLPLPLQEQAPLPKKTRTPNARLPFVVNERTLCAAVVR